MANPTNTLPPVAASLSWKDTLELFKRLSGTGTVGFDYGQHRLQDLRAILSAWINQGVPASLIEAHASDIVTAKQTATRAIPPAPVTIAAPAAPAAVIPPAPAHEFTPESRHPTIPMHQLPPQQSVRDSLAAAITNAQQIQHAPAPAAHPHPFQGLQATTAIVDEMTTDAHGVSVLPATLPPMPEPTPAPVAPATIPPGHKLARDVFGDLPPAIVAAIPPTLTIPVFANPEAEAIDYDYRYQSSTLVTALIAMSIAPSMRFWCGGPRGTGKTEFVRALAARTGRALYRVSFNRFTEASEIVGDMGLLNGNTVWQDGPVAKALRVADGSAALMLDELTYGSAGALACLNGLLERKGAHVRLPRTGETLPVHPLLLIAACDNTFGAGNDSGEYMARNELGADLRDRFQYKLAFTFLPASEERDLLRNAIQQATGRKPASAAMTPIMNLLRTCRAKADAGELQGAPSFRGAVAFATLLAFGVKPADAWTQTVVLGSPDASHEALRLVFSSVWPTDSTGNLETFSGAL